jgi:hypothetical protein
MNRATRFANKEMLSFVVLIWSRYLGDNLARIKSFNLIYWFFVYSPKGISASLEFLK